MTTTQLNDLAEDVRQEGYEPEASMKDLVFDPVSGEFRQINRGSATEDGEIVTEMTNKGFAADDGEQPVVYLAEQDVIDFRASEESHRAGTGRFWPNENVYHLFAGSAPEVVRGKELPVYFCDGKDVMDELMQQAPSEETFFVVCGDCSVEIYRLEPEEENGQRSEPAGPLPFEYIPARANLYSRAKGILEVGALEDKRVMIVGLGSFGSQIAVELAKAGVGSFALFDFDRVELHNLMRHTAAVSDLGRLKTDVIEESILGKNPYAAVDKFPVNINDNLEQMYSEVEKADLVICATDNNTSRFNLSRALVEKSKPGIFGRAITRAEGGDVFRYLPGGPCYCCLVGRGDLQEEISNEASARRDGRIAAYVSPEDAEAMVQVGLSSDIEPICNMMVKLALVELSRGRHTGITCLEEEFVYEYYMWANRRERHYANWKPMPSAGAYPTVMRWYGAHIAKEPDCPVCGESLTLDVGGSDVDSTGLEGIELDLS
jgi:molybdopterin-synthase adenylyltransferase